MRLEIDIPEHQYNNIMAIDSISLGRAPYKGIIMYAINAIKQGKVLEQELTNKNDLAVEKIIDEIEEEFEKVDISIMDKLTLFAKVQNSLYKCAELRNSEIPTGSTTKNDLGVDCVSRKAVINQIFYSTDNNGDVVLGSALRERIEKLPSITPTSRESVDCIDRQATLDAIIKRLGIKNETYLLEAERVIYQQILAMSSVTPQLSSELDKNSKKLEKNFGELDYVSRTEVIDIVENITEDWLKGDINFFYPSLIKKIKGLSSVTPQPRKGHWIIDTHKIRAFGKKNENHDYSVHCDKCNYAWDYTTDKEGSLVSNFCPNCGADMREVEE